jgi:hypothetical protein
MPAWIPLAVVIGAAGSATGARRGGVVLLIMLGAMFVYASVRIDGDPQYQRPAWSRVAAALGKSSVARAVVAYDGEFAAGPLSIYLPRVAWAGPGQQFTHSPAAVSVSELDIVGETWQTLAKHLPNGTTLIGSSAVNGYRVDRFKLSRPWRRSRAQIAAQALKLLGPAQSLPVVLIQPESD